MMYFNLQREMKRLGNIIGVPSEKYPKFTPSNDAHPYIVKRRNHFYYVIQERSIICSKKEFDTSEELLFEVFFNITFSMAVKYELEHRLDGQDCRRLIFEHQLALMGKLNTEWKEKLQREIDRVLLKHPYNDLV